MIVPLQAINPTLAKKVLPLVSEYVSLYLRGCLPLTLHVNTTGIELYICIIVIQEERGYFMCGTIIQDKAIFQGHTL